MNLGLDIELPQIQQTVNITNPDSQATRIFSTADHHNNVDPHLNESQNYAEPLLPTCLTEKEDFQLYMLDSELSDRKRVTWKKGTFLTTEVDWYLPPPTNVITIRTPIDYFSKYFTNELFSLMVVQTNLDIITKTPAHKSSIPNGIIFIFSNVVLIGFLLYLICFNYLIFFYLI